MFCLLLKVSVFLSETAFRFKYAKLVKAFVNLYDEN